MASLTWTSSDSGFWTTASNWSPNQVPGNGDTALITQPGPYLVSVTTSPMIDSLVLDDAQADVSVSGGLTAATIGITAGTLSVSGVVEADVLTNAGTVNVASDSTLTAGGFSNSGTLIDNGRVTLSGTMSASDLLNIGGMSHGVLTITGTVDNNLGTFDATNLAQLGYVELGTFIGGTIANLSRIQMGTLDGVTWLGTLSANNLMIVDGLDLRGQDGSGKGTLNLTDYHPGGISFVGSQIFNHADVTMSGAFNVENTLTIGNDVTITESWGVFPLNIGIYFSAGGAIENYGTILSPSLGTSSPSFNNDGLLAVSGATFDNFGVIDAYDETILPDINPGNFQPGLAQLAISSSNFTNHAGGIIETGESIGTGLITIAAVTNFINDGTMLTHDGRATSTSGGIIDAAGIVNGSGTMEISGGGTVILESAVASTQHIDFVGAGNLTLTTPTFVAAQINGFASNDIIRLGVSATGVSYTAGVLKMQSANGTFDLAITGQTSLSDFIISTESSRTTIQLACFAEGTRFATPSGPVAVEELREGDLVMLADGSELPVVWLGHRHVDCQRHPEPHKVWPIRVRRGAFGSHMPQHDLYLSPDHAVFVRGVLIPIKYLVNDGSIAQVRRHAITYWHVELPRHAVLLAENLPTESLVPGAERNAFDNGGGVTTLHPDFSTRLWEAHGCAPLVITGPVLEDIRASLQPASRRRAV